MTRRSIKFDCHYCLNSVTAWQDECGREFPCPHCQTDIIVPSQPIDASLFDDIFESLNPSESVTPEIVASPTEAVVSQPPRDVAASTVAATKAVTEIASSAKAKDTEASRIETGKKTEASKPESIKKLAVSVPEVTSQKSEIPHPDVMEQLIDEAQSQEASNGSGESDHLIDDPDLIPLDEAPSQEPNITDVPLKIDGWDFDTPTEVISLKCKICDSRVHTSSSKIDTEISCPVCYTKILVTNKVIDKVAPATTGNPGETKLSYTKSDKAKSQDVEAEIPLIPLQTETVSASYSPIFKTATGGSSSEVDRAESNANRGTLPTARNQATSFKSGTKPSNQSTTQQMSRREKYELAQRRLAAQDGPRRAAKAGKSQSKSADNEESNSQTSSAGEARESNANAAEASVIDEAVVQYSQERFVTLLSSPGLIPRATLAAIVIGIGSGMMHLFSDRYESLREPTIPEWILNTLAWTGMGLLPYLIGVGLLWLLCGFVFREAAAGKEQVSDWSIQSFSDLKSTFLIFGFSFFIAGLPISPIPFMFAFVHPLRCLVAPLLLLGAWYHQNALAILAIDAFKHFRRESNDWGKFYMLAIAISLIGFVGALLMLISISWVSFATSMLGAMLVTLSTVLFAAAAGWHCGWVVAGTKKKGNTSAK